MTRLAPPLLILFLCACDPAALPDAADAGAATDAQPEDAGPGQPDGGRTDAGALDSGPGRDAGDPAEFEAACADPSTVVCETFDEDPPQCSGLECATGVFLNGGRPENGPLPRSVDGRLQFTIRSQTGGAAGGQWFARFGERAAGPGQSVYARWEQEFDEGYFEASAAGGGNKLGMLGRADDYSCASNEVVLTNARNRGYPQAYHACGVFTPFEVGNPHGDNPSEYDYQPGGDNECLRSFADPDDCFMYTAGEVFVFELQIDVANDTSQPSRVRVWMTRETRARTLVIDHALVLRDARAGYGALWLMPYNTGKDSSVAHAEGHTWVDNVLVQVRG